jgi:mRNA-degrading endonuclease RelE of RelBE toxin-antitoxin system
MNIPNGYESDILMTLKAFSNQDAYTHKTPHKLQGTDGTMSLDVKSRHDKYRLLFYIDKETGICKITHLCTEETH